MGTYTNIETRNPVRPDLSPIASKALADIGALHLCLPRHIALQLALDTQEESEVTLADEALLGTIPMEDMDLVVVPMTRQVAINPASPNIPSSVAKGIRRSG
jgi:hypothetical protein